MDISRDKAVVEIWEKRKKENIEFSWERLKTQQPQCGFGTLGLCCRNCAMGPCRIDPFGEGPQVGVCGANRDTISARNFLRMVAVGASAHSDHGRAVAETVIKVARGEAPGYEIKDEYKLIKVALDLGIEIEGKKTEEIALEVGEKALAEFGKQEGEIEFIKRAPLKRQKIWRELGVVPRGVDREIVEALHRTHIGTDQHYLSLMKQATRCALGDGWGGSMLATELQDILFGTPYPVVGKANLGVLKENQVNIIVHGHEPLLSEMIVIAAQDPELLKLAKEKGAEGINIAGICCTANEILMRHGIPLAGNFLNQELAVATGAVEVMAVDIQCIMQNIANVAECFHTKIITTSPIARMEQDSVVHIEFDEHHALEDAKRIVKLAIDNFENRKAEVMIPKHKSPAVAGFGAESTEYHLGGTFRGSYFTLVDNIVNGRVRGLAGVVGCNNARTRHNEGCLTVIKELIKNDVLVLVTGCMGIACAEAGLLVPEAAAVYAGPGLAEVCETVGIPPVLHLGSCVDNSRILLAAAEAVKAGGLKDISDVPVAGSAPEWMSEKAISIGHYFVASGVYTVFGATFPTSGAPEFQKYLFEDFEKMYGGMWDFEPDPIKHAQKMIAHIDKKRKDLGIDKARERFLMDVAARQEIEK